MTVMDAATSRGYLKNIHDEYRTALLNKKYYGARLQRYRRLNRMLEILIAVGAAGSAIAGFSVWQQGYGVTVWAVISGTSIVLATIKPLLDLPAQIERYAKLTGEYAKVSETYRNIEQDITAAKGLKTEQLETFNQIRRRAVELAELDDPDPDQSIVQKAYDDVNREVPAATLWMP
jgi:hypothetical protein